MALLYSVDFNIEPICLQAYFKFEGTTFVIYTQINNNYYMAFQNSLF